MSLCKYILACTRIVHSIYTLNTMVFVGIIAFTSMVTEFRQLYTYFGLAAMQQIVDTDVDVRESYIHI